MHVFWGFYEWVYIILLFIIIILFYKWVYKWVFIIMSLMCVLSHKTEYNNIYHKGNNFIHSEGLCTSDYTIVINFISLNYSIIFIPVSFIITESLRFITQKAFIY